MAIKNGDVFIFEQVFYEYHERLYYFILSKTQSNYIAQEVVQLTFIKLWQNRHSLNEELTLSRQIFRIAKTTLIDLWRKEDNLKRLQNELTPKEVTESLPTLDSRELTLRLHQALDMLPPKRRRIFEMSRINGMSHKEIAFELSISSKTVENQISEAIKQLRQYLPLFLIVTLLAR